MRIVLVDVVMNPELSDEFNQFEQLRAVLLPILANAAVGRFDQDVPLSEAYTSDVNELLVGVQLLLEVIREQQAELAVSEARVLEVQNQTTEILARMVDRGGRKPLA